MDRDALGGLAVAIREWAGAFVCISHNAEFVGALCPEIWNVDAGVLTHKGKAGVVEDAFEDTPPASKAASRTASRLASRNGSKAPSPGSSAPASAANSGDEAPRTKMVDGVAMAIGKKKKKVGKSTLVFSWDQARKLTHPTWPLSSPSRETDSKAAQRAGGQAESTYLSLPELVHPRGEARGRHGHRR